MFLYFANGAKITAFYTTWTQADQEYDIVIIVDAAGVPVPSANSTANATANATTPAAAWKSFNID